MYRLPPPLIVVGGAGSGKTALTLEKLKHADGEVLYVTHSAYLAQNARDLYYASGFERDGQEASSSPTANSSSPSACRRDARRAGATLPPGSRACARQRSGISTRIRPSRRSAA